MEAESAEIRSAEIRDAGPLVLLRRAIGHARRSFSSAIQMPWTRRRAERALAHGRRDLEIDWPVEIRWRKSLPGLGRASSAVRHAVELRAPQDAREAERTVLHELYHLAQFHKWGDLHPQRRLLRTGRRLNEGDLERAESLAELYARITAKELRRVKGEAPARARRIEIAAGEDSSRENG